MKSFSTIYAMIAIGLLHGLCTGARADEREARKANAPVVEKAGEAKGADGEAEKQQKEQTPAEQGAGDKETKQGPGKGEPGEKEATQVAEQNRAETKTGQGGPAAGTPAGSQQAEGQAKQQRRQRERKTAAGAKGEKKTAMKAGEKGGAKARFVDRDGDGIRDGQEHRFRGRHRRGKRGKYGGGRDQQMERHRYGAEGASAVKKKGR